MYVFGGILAVSQRSMWGVLGMSMGVIQEWIQNGFRKVSPLQVSLGFPGGVLGVVFWCLSWRCLRLSQGRIRGVLGVSLGCQCGVSGMSLSKAS